MTSIKIGSQKNTSKPKKYYSDDDDDEEYSYQEGKDYRSSERDTEDEGTIEAEGDEYEDHDRGKKPVQNGYDENMNHKDPPKVAQKPFGVFAPPLVSRAKKSWPPPEQRYDAFAVEGMGRVNPYTRQLEPIEDPNKQTKEEEEVVESRTEIIEEHTKPVSQLKKQWQEQPHIQKLGVRKPFIEQRENRSWIKHIKPPPDYEAPPEEPDWKSLVRNRRWNSTVKARFPCKVEDTIEFDRRSTTPKNWKRLLLDKKAVRTIGAITGIGPEGEELLWRLAKQRTTTNEDVEDDGFDIPGEADTLAYEAVKTNLEAAITEAAIQAGVDFDDYVEDEEESQVSGTTTKTRAQSSISTWSPAEIRKKLLRLHPEEFKKLLALDRARDAHLRWQFSTDPYDSVHEHQIQPWELALLTGEKDRRLRFLLRKLLKSDDAPNSVFSSGANTPRHKSSGHYESDPELDVSDRESITSVGSGRQSRMKKKPPQPPPRRGRSASPSIKDRTYYEEDDPEVSHGFLSPEEEDLVAELRKLEELTQGLGLPQEVQDMLRDSAENYTSRQPKEYTSMNVEERLKTFLEEVQHQQGKEPSDIDKDEIALRRQQFLDKERQSSVDKDHVPEKSKTRHKVKRIKSDAELFAVMNKRRQTLLSDEEEAETTTRTTNEIKDLLQDISKTYGKQPKKKESEGYTSEERGTEKATPVDREDEDTEEEDEEYQKEDKDGQKKEKLKSYADQRIKVKPRGRHAASRNPARQLQGRDDEDEETDEDLQSVSGSSSRHEIKISGMDRVVQTGKVKHREHALTDDAKKGLETVEDINAASLSLRTTDKDKTGISQEKINPHDGVSDVMLFHIKGARHVQTRLVEPCLDSLNSGDVFVMVTEKFVHQWNGKNCSIMEKARGTEVTSVIQQWKEMNCQANAINVMDQGREKPSKQTKMFWKELGGKDQIHDEDDVLLDGEFEKGILKSSIIYEVECYGDEEFAELVPMEQHKGKVPSKKWLDSDKSYVLDFGTEVYAWIGRYCKGPQRRKALDLGLEIFNSEYETDSDVNPIYPNVPNPYPGERIPRPDWAVFGKMTELSENVLFRRKFYDWPDPVDLKVKTIESKVHAQLTRDLSEYITVEMSPISGRQMAADSEEPNMVLNGMQIGRGKGGRDPETLFRFAVVTNSIQMWRVIGKSYEEISNDQYGIFYSAEAYIIRWSFQIMRTGIRNIKGGKSKKEDIGRDSVLFFYWQGQDCSTSDKGTAAIVTSEIDNNEGPSILVQQGKEPPAFYQLFNGSMVVNNGKESDDEEFERTRMYWVRNEEPTEGCLVEIPLSSANMRSRSCLVICEPINNRMLIWHGEKSANVIQSIAVSSAKKFRANLKKLYNKKITIIEMEEGSEEEQFWDCFPDDEDYVSFLGVAKDFDFTPRCFYFNSIHGEFAAAEITSSSYLQAEVCPFPILQSELYQAAQPALFFIDAKYKMYLWQGWWPYDPENKEEKQSGPTTGADKHRFDTNRRLAMQSIVDYAQEVNQPTSKATIIYAGLESLEFKNLFPFWEDHPEVTEIMEAEGKKRGKKVKLEEELAKLSKTYSV